jgi:transposase
MEKRETITLDARAQQRLAVLDHVLAGELSPATAAAYLRLSSRQLRRLLKAYRANGAAALVHGNTGRSPVNRLADEKRARLVELATDEYAGFNPVHLAQTLTEERPELTVSPRTVRRVLAAGRG